MIPVVAATLDCLLAPVNAGAALRARLQLRIEVPGVVLSFDDGPHPEGTPAILELLAKAGCRATFFMVGEQVERRPALAQRIVSEGHRAELHAFRHRLQLRLGDRAVVADIRRGRAAIEDATGRSVEWHRPPYGIYSPAGLGAVRAEGLRPLLWSSWGKDWRKLTTPERIAGRALRRIGPGDVILLHDADFYSSRGSHRRTVDALPRILSELKRLGLDTVLPV